MTTMKKRAQAYIASAVLLFVFMAGCGDQQKDLGNVTDDKAVLAVNFDPNPAAPLTDGKWQTIISVTETAGIGVNIYGAFHERFALTDEESHRGEIEQLQFEKDFRACGGEGNYIPPGGVRCTPTATYPSNTNIPNQGYLIFTFYGVDDLGNEVIGEGRLELL